MADQYSMGRGATETRVLTDDSIEQGEARRVGRQGWKREARMVKREEKTTDMVKWRKEMRDEHVGCKVCDSVPLKTGKLGRGIQTFAKHHGRSTLLL
jgi:hypothetical protein